MCNGFLDRGKKFRFRQMAEIIQCGRMTGSSWFTKTRGRCGLLKFWFRHSASGSPASCIRAISGMTPRVRTTRLRRGGHRIVVVERIKDPDGGNVKVVVNWNQELQGLTNSK